MSLTLDESTLEPLSPSCKLVYFVLEDCDEWVAVRDLIELTTLPESTTCYALERLIEAGAVDRKQDIRDARRRLYRARSR